MISIGLASLLSRDYLYLVVLLYDITRPFIVGSCLLFLTEWRKSETAAFMFAA